MKKNFQELIICLQDYWKKKGCIIMQPIDIEVGAGTSHPITYFRSIEPNPIAVCYVQPVRRPCDGRYGKSLNRLQQYYQFQVIIKPVPNNIQNLYLESLRKISINIKNEDIRFVEDDWENPTLGAWGIGWEVWLNGMEITQFTYFQQVGSIICNPVTVEITYGLERLSLHIQEVKSVYDLVWSDNMLGSSIKYSEILLQNENEQSFYNFEYANTSFLFDFFDQCEKEATFLINLKNPLIFPAYDFVLKAAHTFNLLDSRKVISKNEKKFYISRIRKISKKIAEIYLLKKNILNKTYE